MSKTLQQTSPQDLELNIGGFGSFHVATPEPATRPAKQPVAIEDPVMELARSLAALSLRNPSGFGVGAQGFRPFR